MRNEEQQYFRLDGVLMQSRMINPVALAKDVSIDEVAKVRKQARELVDWLKALDANLPKVSP